MDMRDYNMEHLNVHATYRNKNKLKPASILYSTFLFANLALISNTYANPQGGNVVGGRGSIHTHGNTTAIHQQSQNMAIDWRSYNVQQNERIQYIQPNSRSISLNRILGNNASTIRGEIDANGQVILVNPNGIFFSPTATINVGGILASGLDIKPSDFMNGNYIFNEVSGTDGFVLNSGIINAATGGNVSLLGKQVRNDGVIVANLGAVNLAAGNAAVVTFDNVGLLGVKITKEILQNELGVDPAVLNNGNINVEGGRILLTASMSQDIFSRAVNTGDIEQATSVVVNADGTFTLGGGADVVNAGKLDVSTNVENQDAGTIIVIGENVTSSGVIKADSDNGNGGNIELHATDTTMLTGGSVTSAQANVSGVGGVIKILGNKVGLGDQTKVNASGANGGGEILIGGDITGNNKAVRNAEFIYLGENTNVNVDALDNGSGGKLITFASDTARIYGNLTARGGINSGNGGFIETSGLRGFDITGAPDISAVNGRGGEWLIDPYNITIESKNQGNNNVSPTSNINKNETFSAINTPAKLDVDLIYKALDNDNSRVTITTGSGSANTPEAGNITFVTEFDYSKGGKGSTLVLNAANDIDTNKQQIISSKEALNIEFNANMGAEKTGTGSVIILDSFIDTNGGNFKATGVDFTLTETNIGNNLNTGNGKVNINMTGAITINGAITTNNGSVDITGNTFSSNTSGIITATDGSGNDANGDVTITTNGTASTVASISIGGSIATQDGDVTLAANQDLNTVAGTVALTAAANITSANGQFAASGASYNAAAGSSLDMGSGDIALSGITGTINLGNTKTTGNLTASGVGAVTQNVTDTIDIGGSTGINAGTAGVTLNGAGNDFDRVNIIASNLTIQDKNALRLDAISISAQGSLDITTGGNLSQVGGTNISSSGKTVINSGGGIALANTGNSFAGTVSLNTIGNGNVAIRTNGGIDFAASNLGTGSLTVDASAISQAAGAIKQTAGAGTVSFTASSGAITLANTANDFTGNVSLKNIGANDVAITDANDITLAASNIGRNLTVTAVTGDINEVTSGGGINVGSGKASFNVAAGQSIRLGNINNNFSTYALNNTGTGFADITLWRNTDIDLQALNLTGDLDVNAVGAITNTAGGLVIGGATILNANNGAAQNITLNATTNNFNTVAVTSGNDLDIRDANAIALAGLNLSGDLSVNANGNVTQSASIVMQGGTTANINAGTGNIDLSTATGNDFKNIVLTAAGSASVSDINAITIGDAANAASTIGGNLTIKTNGSINQTAAITMGNNSIADFDAGSGQINLAGYDNNFATINLASSNSVNIKDVGVGGITLGATNITGSGTLTINSDGAISSNGSGITVAGLTALYAAANAINLSSGINDFNQISVSNASSLAISDSNALVLGSINLSGTSGTTLSITTNGALTQTAALTNNGNTIINSGSGAISLNNNNNDFVGTVSLNNTSGNVTINDANSIQFAASSLGSGSFSVNAGLNSGGGISQTGAITQATGAGSVTLNAGAGVITLNNSGNNFVGEMAISNSGSGNNVVIVDTNNVALAQSNVSADLSITAGSNGDITQNNTDSGLTVAGTATFNVDGGRSIILGNVNNNINGLSFNAKANTGNSLQNITIANNAALNLQTLNLTGDLNVNITGGGDITNTTGNMLVAGTTTLNTSGNIDLTNGLNNFNIVNVTAANNLSLTDINGLTFAGANLTGNLTVTANGNINQTAAITMAANSAADFNAGNGQINLGVFNNNFGTVNLVGGNLASGNSVNIKDVGAGGLTLGATNISGALNIVSDGAINDNGSGISVSGITTLDAAVSAISLNTGTNDFNQITVSNAASLAVSDSNALTLGALNLSGSGTTLNIKTNGALSQTTAITNNGDTLIDTGAGAITLNNNNNDFIGTVSLNNTSGNVIINDQNNIDFATSTLGSGSFSVNAGLNAGGGISQTGGAITQAAGAGSVSLNAGTGVITLNNATNDFVGDITINNSGAGNNVTINNSSDVALAQSLIAGDLSITAGANSDITQNNNDSGLTVAGTATFNVDGGRSVSMGNTQNDFNGLAFNAKVAGEQLNNVTVADKNALDLQTLNLTGNLTVTAGGNIDNSSGSMLVAGVTTLSAVGGDIDLTNGTNDFNQVVIKTANNVSINENNTLTIGNAAGTESSINGNLTINSNGDINQTVAITMQTGTTAQFNAGSGSINLGSRTGNDFKNVVLTAAGNVNLSDSNDIIIGNASGSVSSIGGNFTLLTQGDITQTAAITMSTGSTANFSAGNGVIDFGTLNNNFDNIELASSSDVFINDVSGGLSLGTTSITGTGSLTVNSSGAIRNDAGNIRVDGLTVLNAGNNAITLTNGSHDFNDIIINGGNVAINDISAINIGDRAGLASTSTISGSLTLVTNGNITDTNSTSVQVGNAATLFAGAGDIALSNTDFQSTLTATAANTISVNDVTNLSVVNVSAANNVELIAAGSIITQSGTISSNRVALTAVNGIDVTTQAARLKVDNTSGDITINNTGDVILESLKTVGDITLNNDANISMLAGSVDADYDTGIINMTTATGSFLGLGTPDENLPDITAFSGTFIGRQGSFGSAVRPLVIRIKDTIIINTRQSVTPTYVPVDPRVISDISDIQFDFIDASNAVAGEQLITLEELEDIDPAIFSDVRNYSYGQIAIRLPRDQLFEDELKAVSEK